MGRYPVRLLYNVAILRTYCIGNMFAIFDVLSFFSFFLSVVVKVELLLCWFSLTRLQNTNNGLWLKVPLIFLLLFSTLSPAIHHEFLFHSLLFIH